MLRTLLFSTVAILGVVAIPGVSRADDDDRRFAYGGNWNDQYYRGNSVSHRHNHNHFQNNRGYNDRYRYQGRSNYGNSGFSFGFSSYQPQPYIYNPAPVYQPAPVYVPAPVYRPGCW